jgi:tripartite-type tricarboxylate transporter receptor subunit TctC
VQRRQILATGAAFAAALAAPALAQTFPSRPVRIIVPYGAGGATDIVARIMAEHASREAGQSFIVENRGGGASIPGTQAVATSTPDGYTIGFIDTAIVINPGLFAARLPYDTERDLAPVGLVASAPLLFAAHPRFGAATLPEVVAFARANPDVLNIGHAGNGTAIHLASAQFLLAGAIRGALIAYRGGGPMLAGLLSHDVDVAFSSIPAVKPHVDGGRLRALGVTSPRPSPVMPDVPTFASAGLDAVDAQPFFGVVAPSGTPPEILDRLNTLLVAPARQAQVATRLAGIGYEVEATDRARFAAIIAEDTAKWRGVITRSGITAD